MSDGSNWENIGFAHFQQPPCDVQSMYRLDIGSVNVGKPVRLEQAVDGQRKAVDSIAGESSRLFEQFRWDKS